MDPFIAQITVFGCNFAPLGWALCQGQVMSISQYTALFSLIGTYYGGNGQTTFALPDLRSRAPIGFGQGPGLSNYAIGETGGQETVSINTSSYPTHTHGLFAGASPATANTPGGLIEAEGQQTGGRGGAVNLALYSASGAPTPLAPAALTAAAGGGQPHNNLQPYLTLNFCIALQGIFPARS